MSVLSKALGKPMGPIRRLVFAFLALFAPGKAMVAVVKGFLLAVETLDEEAVRALVAEMQND